VELGSRSKARGARLAERRSRSIARGARLAEQGSRNNARGATLTQDSIGAVASRPPIRSLALLGVLDCLATFLRVVVAIDLAEAPDSFTLVGGLPLLLVLCFCCCWFLFSGAYQAIKRLRGGLGPLQGWVRSGQDDEQRCVSPRARKAFGLSGPTVPAALAPSPLLLHRTLAGRLASCGAYCAASALLCPVLPLFFLVACFAAERTAGGSA
jgi:hypothetical protein